MRWLLYLTLLTPLWGQPPAETPRQEILEIYVKPQLQSVARTVCVCGDCLTGDACQKFLRACRAAVEQGRCPAFPRGNGRCEANRAGRCRDLVRQALRAETDPQTLEQLPPPQPGSPSPVGDAGEPRKPVDWTGPVGTILNQQFAALFARQAADVRRRLTGQTTSVEFTAFFQAGLVQHVEVGPVTGGSAEFQTLARQAVEALAGKKIETPAQTGRAAQKATIVWSFQAGRAAGESDGKQ